MVGQATNLPSRNPVLLIHGLYDTTQVFSKMESRLMKLGWSVHSINLTPNIGTLSLDKLAVQVAEYIESVFESERPIDLIGFSMGGIVTRYYLQRLGGISRVHRYINISAPNYGTLTAYLLPLPGIAQMRPNSSFLKDLNADAADSLEKINSTVIWTPFDLMIFPASSSSLNLGKEVKLPVLLHGLMPTDSKVLAAVAAALSEPLKPSHYSWCNCQNPGGREH